MFNHPYICLSTKDDLSDDSIKSWFKSVDEAGPSGIITATELTANNKPQRFYRRKINGMNRYCVVLCRDLEGEEVRNIALAVDSSIPSGDFEISWSQHPQSDDRYAVVQEDLLKAIALEASKRNHGKWLNKKINEGWRFGQNFNSRGKVSPMCREWHALNERYQAAEYHRMISLIQVLEEMNLSLMAKKS
jgi:hypothetical protein